MKFIEIVFVIGKVFVLDFEDFNSLVDKESKGMICCSFSYVLRVLFLVIYNYKIVNILEFFEKKSKC